VTIALPLNTAVFPVTRIELTLPVTYIALTSNSPLSAPVATAGARARHSKLPPCASAWNATTVVTGIGTAPRVPPSMIVLPAPETWWLDSFDDSAAGCAAAPISARARTTAPTAAPHLYSRRAFLSQPPQTE